ncbi:hypothetical protein PB2503_04647 [Parvularcula bermudensis HTCC2503]|uniref:Zinc finger CHCC-type domain-containing protein n=1 Tax=Parvularcula bermudensis (strain ATCC BAA-594 / HTCC2503 / KCTC 12087) TaxID=314260 RepID=E0TF86_PARBH|nr:zinc-finger domain-containing protein [Parvularcula bermudensis]ADM09004.1 hypothetical protein PB2503_04647 [Parvularcula bermudensis HTCC2503]
MTDSIADQITVPLDRILDKVAHRPESLEVVFTDQRRVVCDGPGGGLGHPRVFYTIGTAGYAECGYCDRVFVFDPSRKGERLEGRAAIPASHPQAGLSERAVPPPGEILKTGGDSDA